MAIETPSMLQALEGLGFRNPKPFRAGGLGCSGSTIHMSPQPPANRAGHLQFVSGVNKRAPLNSRISN